MTVTSSSFKINEKVGFLLETGGGIIKRIDEKGFLLVEDETGFERLFRSNELVKIYSSEYHLPEDRIAQINEDDTISTVRHTSHKETQTGSKKPIDIWEIDLHIESLIDSNRGMSNSEILTIQMKEFKNFYKRARERHIRKLIVIHGVGEGVLKDDVRLFLSTKDGVEYYDANYNDYGKGATAVKIRYNASF